MKHPLKGFLLMVLGLCVPVPFLFGDEIHEAAKSGDLAKIKALIEKTPGLIDALLLRPLPVANAERLFEVSRLSMFNRVPTQYDPNHLKSYTPSARIGFCRYADDSQKASFPHQDSSNCLAAPQFG